MLYGQRAFSCLQQAPLQQVLHVTTPIGDQEYIEFVFDDAINDPVRLEKISRKSRIPKASNSIGVESGLEGFLSTSVFHWLRIRTWPSVEISNGVSASAPTVPAPSFRSPAYGFSVFRQGLDHELAPHRRISQATQSRAASDIPRWGKCYIRARAFSIGRQRVGLEPCGLYVLPTCNIEVIYI